MVQKTLDGSDAEIPAKSNHSTKSWIEAAQNAKKFAFFLAPTKAAKAKMALRILSPELIDVESKYGEDGFAQCIRVLDINANKEWNLRVTNQLLLAMNDVSEELNNADSFVIKTQGSNFDLIYEFEITPKQKKQKA